MRSNRHPFDPRIHENVCRLDGLPSYDPVHAPTEDEYRRRKAEVRNEARRRARPRGRHCRVCGVALSSLLSWDDRDAHSQECYGHGLPIPARYG